MIKPIKNKSNRNHARKYTQANLTTMKINSIINELSDIFKERGKFPT